METTNFCESADSLFSLCLRFVAERVDALLLAGEPSLPPEIGDRLCERFYSGFDERVAAAFGDAKRASLSRLELRSPKASLESLLRVLGAQRRLRELRLFDCDARLVPDRPPSTLRSLMVVSDSNASSEESHTSLIDLDKYATLERLELIGARCIVCGNSLTEHARLVSLTLHDVSLDTTTFELIARVRTLRALDVSRSGEPEMYPKPDEILAGLVQSLPQLRSLDVSGTNLAGDSPDGVLGLVGRIDNPLDFLGLYGTAYDACRRQYLPATIVSGDANRGQILAATRSYSTRPATIKRALADLVKSFEADRGRSEEALEVVAEAIMKNKDRADVRVACVNSLLGIFALAEREQESTSQRMLDALLSAIERHPNDAETKRSAFDALCRFPALTRVAMQDRRISKILVECASNHDNFVRKTAAHMLCSLACRADADHRRFLGRLGVVSKMSSFISNNYLNDESEDALESAWGTVWSVTYATPSNCHQFLCHGGVELFLGCVEKYSGNPTLLRNALGSLGNVADFEPLRPCLMHGCLLRCFASLLDSSSEIGYIAAGILAHVASDGEGRWTIAEPSRRSVLDRLTGAIEHWSLASKHDIVYENLECLVNLVRAYHTPECQHWATWTLANLTTICPESYCSLIKAENGEELLSEVIASPLPYDRIKVLAQTVLDNCAKATPAAE